MKKLLAALALTAAALATAALPAAAASTGPAGVPAPPAAMAEFIPAALCTAGGGQVVDGSSSPTGLVCQDGDFDGAWVIPDLPSGPQNGG